MNIMAAPYSVLFLIFLIGNATYVHPCSCGDQSQRERFRKADYIFLGQVTEIADSKLDYFVYAVKFKVEKLWKGSRKAELTVNFDLDTPGFCGDLHLEKDKTFLIYAYREQGALVSFTDCGPNLRAEYAATSIKKLNNPLYRIFARVYPF